MILVGVAVHYASHRRLMMCDEDQVCGPDDPEAEFAETSWLIQQRSPDGELSRRYLQIGTGQWCSSEYATRFPLRRTAIAYAHEFGYSIGHTAEIVPYQVKS
jgi:hypothetical protein